jgi:hypothetical protein
LYYTPKIVEGLKILNKKHLKKSGGSVLSDEQKHCFNLTVLARACATLALLAGLVVFYTRNQQDMQVDDQNTWSQDGGIDEQILNNNPLEKHFSRKRSDSMLSTSMLSAHDVSKKKKRIKSPGMVQKQKQMQLCLKNPSYCGILAPIRYMYYLPNVKFFNLPASSVTPPETLRKQAPQAPPKAPIEPARSPRKSKPIEFAPRPSQPPPPSPPRVHGYWNRPLGSFGYARAGRPIPRVCLTIYDSSY